MRESHDRRMIGPLVFFPWKYPFLLHMEVLSLYFSAGGHTYGMALGGFCDLLQWCCIVSGLIDTGG